MHVDTCRYHSPTAYSVVAMSPFELLFYDSLFMTPLFLFPVHGLVYVAVLVYVYYFGLMDHSGIKMESWFPWQPNTMFHDDHHRYTMLDRVLQVGCRAIRSKYTKPGCVNYYLL